MGRKAEKLSVRRQMGRQCGWRYGEEMATPREVPAAAIHDHNENTVTTLGTFLIDNMYVVKINACIQLVATFLI